MTISKFLQWQPNVFLYRSVGWRNAWRYLVFLGSLYYALQKTDREKLTRFGVEVSGSDKSASDLAILQKRIIRGTLSHYFEKIFNAYETLPAIASFLQDHVSAPSLHKLDEALKRNKGVLFVTAHYGGVEYIPVYLSIHRYPLSVVFRCSTSQLQDRLHKRADDLKIRVIDPEKGNTAAAVIRDLKMNRVVFIECDEIKAWSPSQSERMNFLGKDIGVDRTLNLIQRRSGAEILFGIAHRSDMNAYSLIIETYTDILSHLPGVPSSPSAALLKRLERYIYTFPHEWYQWKHYDELDKPTAVKAKTHAPALKPSFRPA
jgi:lauroyl/myristoyl acyltransferase